MSSPARPFPELPSEARARGDEIIERFETAWERGERPAIDELLPGDAAARLAVLIELVHVELELRLKAGEAARVEDYLDRFPELADGDLLLELLAAEYSLRRRQEPALTVADYETRFPDHGSLLRGRLVELGAETTAHPNRSTAATDLVPSDASRRPADRAGRYLLEGEIAFGGMGRVLRARDPELNRPLAIKVMRAEHRGQPELERRFREEAQITGQLQHPGIPPVYEVGTLPDGRPFFAMKLIQGDTLADLLKERARPGDDLPRFLTVFEHVCQTLAYAHSRGVIHRDLKPSNVMVGAFGEVQVMDWGLAKVLTRGPVAEGARPTTEVADAIATVRTESPGLSSQAGAVLGTPTFMAPEQARGEVELLDERCDVFGLGAILCVILTGRPPYAGTTREEVLRLALCGNLTTAFARLEASAADAELIQLAKACLAGDNQARPRDAGTVAQAVAAYQAGVQERLRQAELQRAQAQVKAAEERKRRRLWRGLAAAVALLVFAGLGAALWYQQDRVERAAEQARQETRRQQAEQEIVRALAEAARPLDEVDSRLQEWKTAHPLLNRPARWQALLEGSRAALQRGQVLLRSVAEGATPSLRERLQELRQRWDTAAADRQLAARLDDIRQDASRLVDGTADSSRAGPRYAAALQALGLDPEKDDPQEEARLRALRVRLAVVAALDHWALLAKSPRLQRRLMAVAKAVDPDPWRDRLRDPQLWKDSAALQRLAAEADIASLSPPVLEMLARRLWAAGGEAAPLVRQALLHHPEDFWLHFWLGVNQAPAEAAASYRAALAVRPNSQVVYNNLGAVLAKQKDFAGAVAALNKAIELDPNAALAYNNLGNVLLEQRQPAKAEAAYRRALGLKPNFPAAHDNLGLALRERGRPKEAEAVYRQAIARRPNYPEAHYNLGIALAQQGERTKAAAAYRQAIELKPNFTEAHFNLGNTLAEQGEQAKAERAYRRAIEFKPNHPEAHHNLGLTLAHQGRLEEAEPVFRQALKLKPNFPEAYNSLGNTLLRRQRPPEAEAAYRQAIKLKPNHARAHYNLGNALRSQGRRQEAETAYRQAIALKPNYPEAHYHLGVALEQQGQAAKAATAYHQAIEQRPSYFEAHFNLGNVLLGQGQLARAEAAFRRAIQLKPNDPEAHYNLGNSLANQGEASKAAVAYRDAIRFKPDFAAAHNGLGVVLLRQRRWKAAEAALRQAVKFAPGDAEPHINLGMVLRIQGEFVAALAVLKRGHELGSRQPGWRHPSARWVEETERLAKMDRKLSAVIHGKAHPADAAEQLALAQFSHVHKRLYAAAARLYAEAFRAQPHLADEVKGGQRYAAARAAALAAAGKGEDAATLAPQERGRWRKQARDWLRADLESWARQADKGPPEGGAALEKTLRQWQAEADFAGVRDPAALAKLLQAERAAWEWLWADVQALREKARGKEALPER